MKELIRLLATNQAKNDGKVILEKPAADRIIDLLITIEASNQIRADLQKEKETNDQV